MKKVKEPGQAIRPAAYRKVLLEKRQQVMTGLGSKFDTLAKMGRVAEEDQAQMSHDEFISLRLNSLDYVQLPREPADLFSFRVAMMPLPFRYWQVTNTRYLLAPAGLLPSLNQQSGAQISPH